jgi:hypothetical protein
MWGMGPYTVQKVILKLFPARESLVGDIPAGDGKIANLFLQCMLELTKTSHVDSKVQLSKPRRKNADECFPIYSNKEQPIGVRDLSTHFVSVKGHREELRSGHPIQI